jgi:hypothetical protein
MVGACKAGAKSEEATPLKKELRRLDRDAKPVRSEEGPPRACPINSH